MIVVVDTNIMFSAILSPKGTISDLLLNSSDVFDFYALGALVEELENHQRKLLELSGFSEDNLKFLKRMLLKTITFIDLESLRPETWEKAFELTKGVDEFDTPFIALGLELGSPVWTGDKKLKGGLEQKGIDWVLNTETIRQIRNKE